MEPSPGDSSVSLIQVLPHSPCSSEPGVSHWPKHGRQRLTSTLNWIVAALFLSILINIALVLTAVARQTSADPRWDEFTLPCKSSSSANGIHGDNKADAAQAPAETAISHKLIVFRNGINSDKTQYQGRPNEENNRLWKDLYSHERTRISYDEALKLPNKTSPEAPYKGSGYLIVLNVFHNLHCLDSIRRAFHHLIDPRWTAQDNPYTHTEGGIDEMLQAVGKDLGITHVDHCIDALRQHQMCAADVTPNVFQFSPGDFGIRAMANVVHECRDFDKVGLHL
ncbi:hypothetical protein OCS_00680 [Ophiocordyceps sinensis CO18]|uniref:Tat pathway signal sequence n=1 Tax=Ophiocordyceps sinensis (strain Co18 / CGMCC 3.14243) TaxID=911162 RepID=T5ADR4_OPHSC|nr:hypothetical protein OCS_00680 [Ophiocordyceps sinensis CO18]